MTSLDLLFGTEALPPTLTSPVAPVLRGSPLPFSKPRTLIVSGGWRVALAHSAFDKPWRCRRCVIGAHRPETDWVRRLQGHDWYDVGRDTKFFPSPQTTPAAQTRQPRGARHLRRRLDRAFL